MLFAYQMLAFFVNAFSLSYNYFSFAVRFCSWSRSSVFASCEAEVNELMRQIDLMVQAKRRENEQAMAGLQAKLDDKERELIIKESTLEARHTEASIASLHYNLRSHPEVFQQLLLRHFITKYF